MTAGGKVERRPTASGPTAPAGWAACSTRSASAPTAGWRRSAGTPPATSSCTSPPRAPAGCCTPSTSGCSPSSSSTWPTTPRTRSSSSTSRWPGCCGRCSTSSRPCATSWSWTTARARCPTRPAGKEVHDYEELLAAAAPVDVPASTTRTGPRRCATRAAPPATPRASSTRTARRSCTPTACWPPAGSGRREEPTGCCRSCPMFHANAWGLAHAAVACGADLVMPGPDLSPGGLAALIESERVTVAAGVPTIWMGVLPELKGRDMSSAAGHPLRRLRGARGRCRRPTASRSACRSCRRGA